MLGYVFTHSDGCYGALIICVFPSEISQVLIGYVLSGGVLPVSIANVIDELRPALRVFHLTYDDVVGSPTTKMPCCCVGERLDIRIMSCFLHGIPLIECHEALVSRAVSLLPSFAVLRPWWVRTELLEAPGLYSAAR